MNAWLNTTNLVTPASLVDPSQLGGTFHGPWSAAVAAMWQLRHHRNPARHRRSWFFNGATQTVLVDNVMINSTTYTFEPAPTKDSCKKGGWQNFTSSPGLFKNQGDCVSFFANGKNDSGD